MSGADSRRRTPEPAHVRVAMLSLFAQGMGLGFLGILASWEALSAQDAGFGYAAAVGGALLGALPGPRFVRRHAAGPATWAVLASCGTVSAAGLVALAAVRSQAWETAPLLLLGLAAGASLRLSASVMLRILPVRPASSLLALAGVSFGLGGMAACLAASNEFRLFGLASFPLLAATAPATMVFAALRAIQLNPGSPEGSRQAAQVRPRTTPRSVLLAASLILQASGCGIAACWLAAYLSRASGFSGTAGALTVGLLWLAVSAGWAASRRLPEVRGNLMSLGIPVGVVGVGTVLLLWPISPLTVAVGTALLGSGMGALVPLTLGLASWPSALHSCRWITRSMHLTLTVALLTSWAVGALSYSIATDAVIWGMLACFAGALIAIIGLVGDYRVSGDPVVI